MFANFLIGLREGFEAALIVVILVAYLVKAGDRRAVRMAWLGVGIAIGVSVGVGLLLTFINDALSDKAATAFAGAMSVVAVCLITWMVFWMASRAKGIKQHLHGEMDRALAASGVAVAAVAFAAVTREGVETALFLWAGIRSSGTTTAPVIGALLGLATAVLLGVLMYRGAVRLNMARLFLWTGAALIVVAGGVLRYAVAEFQELGWLPGEHNTAFDLSGAVPPDGIVGTFIRGTVNLTPTMNWLEVAVWMLYVIPTLIIFFRVIKGRPKLGQNTASRVAVHS